MNADKKHTSEELAEALIYPITVTSAQKEEVAQQLAAARTTSQEQMTDRDRLMLLLLQLKFRLENLKEQADKRINQTSSGYFGN